MSNSKSSNHVALLALISLIPIFVFVIGNGWASILVPYVQLGGAPSIDSIVAYTAGIMFGLVSVILAWAVASERARLRHDKTSKYTWFAYLVFLFALSALGTMNWLFKVSEIPTFIKEAATSTSDSLKALDELAQKGITLAKTEALQQAHEEQENKLRGLVTQLKGELDAVRSQTAIDQEKLRIDIETLFDAFKSEVTNEMRAGCGEVAKGYIDEIKVKLGEDLNLPSGNCRDAKPDALVRSYEAAIKKAMDRRFGNPGAICEITPRVKDIANQIETIIKVPPTALGSGCPSSETVISDTEQSVEKYIASLPETAPEERGLVELGERSSKRLRDQIDAVNEIYLDAEKQHKEIAAPVLKKAWTEYRLVYSDLSSAVDASKLSALPENIDDQRIDKIGDVANTIEILISRYDHLSTYPIVLAGILFDMILIAFFLRVESSRPVKAQPIIGIKIDEILEKERRAGRG